MVEPVPEKFIPVKGQIVNILEEGNLRLRVFDHMTVTGDYFCITDGCSVSSGKCSEWDYCEPVPRLVQFQPWDELGDYNLSANGQFERGVILFFLAAQNAHIEEYSRDFGKPIGFQKLEK